MAGNRFKPIVDCDEVWREVKQMDFGRMAPTNEHDEQTVRGLTNLMKTARMAINNPEQMGINQEQVKVLEKKLKGMKRRWIEECEPASKVDPGVPILRRQGGRWRVYPQEGQGQ